MADTKERPPQPRPMAALEQAYGRISGQQLKDHVASTRVDYDLLPQSSHSMTPTPDPADDATPFGGLLASTPNNLDISEYVLSPQENYPSATATNEVAMRMDPPNNRMVEAWNTPEVSNGNVVTEKSTGPPSNRMLEAWNTPEVSEGNLVTEKSTGKSRGSSGGKKRKKRKIKRVQNVVVFEDSGHRGTQNFASCLEPGGGAYSSRQNGNDQRTSTWVVFQMNSLQVITHIQIEALRYLGNFRRKSQVKAFKLQSSLSLTKPGPWMDVVVVDSVPTSGAHQYSVSTKGVISVYWRLLFLENHGETSMSFPKFQLSKFQFMGCDVEPNEVDMFLRQNTVEVTRLREDYSKRHTLMKSTTDLTKLGLTHASLRVVFRFVLNWQKGEVKRSFTRWMSYVKLCQDSELHAARDTNRRVLERLLNEARDLKDQLAKKTSEWGKSERKLATTSNLLCKTLLTRLVSNSASKLTMRHFAKWKLRTQAMLDQAKERANVLESSMRVVKSSAQRLLNRSLNIGMNEWKTFVHKQQQRERLAKQVMFRMKNSLLWSSFSTWSKAIALVRALEKEVTRKRLLLTRVFSKMMNIRLNIGLHTWRVAIDFILEEEEANRRDLERQRTLMRAVIKRVARGAVWKGFCKWKDVNKFQRMEEDILVAQKRQLHRVVSKMGNTILAKGWATWIIFRDWQRRQEYLMKQTIHRISKGKLWQGFSKWLSYWRAYNISGYKVLLIKKVVLKMSSLYLAGGFRSWVVFLRHHQHCESKMNTVVKRMAHGIVYKGWAQWVHVLHFLRSEMLKRQRQERVMQRVVLKMINAKIAGALQSWFAYVDHKIECESKMQKTIRRMAQGLLYGGWGKWVDVVAFCEEGERQREQKERRLIKVLNRMTHAKTGIAFRGWTEFVAHLKHCEALVNKVIKRMAKRLVTKGWRKWSDVQHFYRQEEFFKLQKRKLMSKVVSKMKFVQTSSAMRTWILFVDHQIYCKAKMKQVVQRMAKGMLCKGWGKWMEVCRFLEKEQARQRIQESLLRRVVLRMKHVRLASGWRGWVLFAAQHKREEDVMGQVVARMCKGVLWKGLRKWVEVWRYSQQEMRDIERQARLLRKVLCRMQQAFVSRGFNAWYQYSRHQLILQDKMSKVILRMSNGQLSAGFSQWKYYVEYEQRNERAMRKVLLRMRCLACSLGLNRWKAFCAQYDQETRLMRRIIGTIKSKKLSLAMKMWVHFSRMMAGEDKKAGAKVAREMTMKRVMGRMSNALLSVGFQKWEKHMEWERRLEHEASKIILKMTKMNLSRGWRSWQLCVKFLVDQERQTETDMSMFMKTVGFSCKSLAANQVRQKFYVWKQEVRHRIHLDFKNMLLNKDKSHNDHIKSAPPPSLPPPSYYHYRFRIRHYLRAFVLILPSS
jgi:hypothetical protein